MKNLAIISTRAITHNRFLNSITYELSKQFNVVLCCRDSKSIIHNSNLSKYDLNFPKSILGFLNFKNNFLLFRDIFEIFNRVEILYLHTPLAAHVVRFLSIFSRNKLKIIYHIHGLRYIPGSWNVKYIFFRFIEYVLSFKTDKFIAINELDFMSLKKYIKPKNIFLIKGLGVDMVDNNNYAYQSKKKNKFVVGVIAAFKKEKGYLELIKIAEECQKYPSIVFRIFGYGNYEWISKLIKKRQINNIQIKGFSRNIEDEINNFDLFLLPSHREGLNVSIQECLSLGIPVITTKIRGCKDLIIEGYNGFLYENFNIDEAIYKILKVYKMNDLEYSLLKQNSFNYAKKYLSRNLLNNQILDIFRDYV